ncbi:MAG: hypothetical protein KIS86_05990 [Devosia sp.]|nr:hypothetical protein [Devosia sp.]
MAADTAGLAKQRIVFLASRQVLYQCLFQAAQRHFSAFDVSHVEQLPVAEKPDGAVRLVLLGHAEGRISLDAIQECRRRFPTTAIGLLVATPVGEMDRSAIAQRLVQGVLPLSLPLDVWLAVTSLLLAGGEYLALDGFEPPPEERLPPAHDFLAPPADPLEHDKQRYVGRVLHGVDHASVMGIESLTARERQILKLVSEGCQNKLIAHRMSLSEHTVKAHVHNLIAKLRVTNRTQAAAAFLHEHELDHPSAGSMRADERSATLIGH